MKLKFISGCSAGKPNLLTLVKDSGKVVVFDCGFQNEMPDFSKIEGEVEEVFITHAHADHIGGLTMLKRMFPKARIFMSEPTLEIGKITIGSLEIMNKYKIPQSEIEEVMSDVETVKDGVPLKFDEYKVLPIYAGHLLGALSYLIKFDSMTVLYTGDVSVSELPLAGKLEILQGNIDLLISETNFSLGFDTFSSAVEKIAQMVAAATKVKGRIIMPMPAAGRAQEIAIYLSYKMLNGEIPHTTIYVDGSIKDVMKIYDRYSSYLRGYLAEYYFKVRSSGLIKLVSDDMRKDLVKNEKPLIVLTTSANMKYGPSLYYAEEVFLDENSTILFTGRVDDKTLAKRIINSKKGELVEFKGIALSRKCNVLINEVNEHGNASDMLDTIKKIGIKSLILMHGNDVVKQYMSQFFIKENPRFFLIEPLEGDLINLAIIFNLARSQKAFLDEEFFEALIERIIEAIRSDYDKGRMLTRDYVQDVLNKNDIILEIRNIEKAKQFFFIAFRYAVKYSYKDSRIDFKFVSDFLEVISEIISDILGKSNSNKLFAQLGETAAKFFKNLVLKGGTLKADLGIKIQSLENLKDILNDFETNFSRFGIKAPSVGEIKKLCEQELIVDNTYRNNYLRVFG
ncbi:MAG TPA: MBL fold metallo-hydrolase [Geobacterales bacterium]|nr:MBL fold metallo-hydrolase [Geobacterales bacterium]